jgi:hypothetical protein
VQDGFGLVCLGPGTYHGVTNNKVGINVAWNVGPETADQITQMAEVYDKNVADKQKHIVPVIELLSKLVMEKDYHNKEVQELAEAWIREKVLHAEECIKSEGRIDQDEDLDSKTSFCDHC